MRHTVHVRRAAELDVAEAQYWYEKQRPGLAAEFHAEFVQAIGRLTETPLLYPAVYRGVRRAVLHRFPFLVWYQVHDSSITVLACTHGKLNPRKLAARLR
ncbi:MAG: type II toxin-antitoxin system RelE/ParE family toxin [Nevskiales bacterium]